MWILESDADFLMGKRMWLKPGKKYLFGRVKRDGVQFAIDHKTISRKHFVITVEAVQQGGVAKVHARSKISITDLKSKQGTYVGGELLSDDTRELKEKENFVRPGHFQQDLVIRWQPCVLTFSITSKEAKAGALKPKQDRLQELDVKVVSEYVKDETTHVVVSKRNTAKGLQALIQGRHIVADSFVDALVYAATPSDLGEEENLSPLEQDFNLSWPKEAEHLPPIGKEPTARPDAAYSPDSKRATVFENFTFVFGDQKQYEQLLPPISLGHGKGLLYKVVPGQTSVDQLVQYLQNTAGFKGFGHGSEATSTGGVILVKWNDKGPHQEWTHNLINDTTLKLNQRPIDQAEFLDAVLANDASSLRGSVLPDYNLGRQVTPAPSSAPQMQTSPTSPLEVGQHSLYSVQLSATSKVIPAKRLASPNGRLVSSNNEDSAPGHASGTGATNDIETSVLTPAKRSKLRGAPIAKLKAFDDGFDVDSIDTWAAQSRPHSVGGEIWQSQDSNASAQVKDEPSPSRKRRRSSSPSRSLHDSQDDMDDMLPAAAAMKRRKIALEAETQAHGRSVQSNLSKLGIAKSALEQKRPKRKVEINVREAVREQREKDEKKARIEIQELTEGLRHDDDGKPANLVVVEPIKVREPAQTQTEQQDYQTTIIAKGYRSTLWDQKWNGRKNFKKFAKSWPSHSPHYNPDSNNDAPQIVRRRQNVIVPLVEVKKRTYGIGDKYWDIPRVESEQDEGRSRGKTVRRRQKETQSQTQRANPSPSTGQLLITQTQTIGGSASQLADERSQPESPEVHGSDGASPTSTRTSPELNRLQAEAASIVQHAVRLDTPRRTRLADKMSTQTQTQSSRVAGKDWVSRPSRSTKSTGHKNQQKIPVTTIHGSESDEDSDDMKFRFRKTTLSNRAATTGGPAKG